MSISIAVVGAGIYGSSTAIKLAELGHKVTLFDPLGILRAASAINQFRVHAGYHYPRSPETIREVQEARAEFLQTFAPAIVSGSTHYYAVPHEGSLTSAEEYERVMRDFSLPYKEVKPDWVNFQYIARCWQVDEALYDPNILREMICRQISDLDVTYLPQEFTDEMADNWDVVIWATYGLHKKRTVLPNARIQVAEKVLIELPRELRHVALVVVDGPFTAFDPYCNTGASLFGSAKFTNHWSSDDQLAPIPEEFRCRLNEHDFRVFPNTNFQAMVDDCALTIPAARHAKYLGSRFTIRVVENNPKEDKRILYITRVDSRTIHIFSGKVVGAVKAARAVAELIGRG